MRASVRRRVLAALLLLSGALSPAVAGAELDAAAADELITTTWFEGMPAERIEALAPDALAHLQAVLADPREGPHHAAALELLGRAGGPGAYEVVAAYAAAAPKGTVEGHVYRARLAVPIALGYLARRDDRALADLLAGSAGSGDAAWSYRQLDAARVGRLLRQHAVSGLALSRRPEAKTRLRKLARDRADRAGVARHAAALLSDAAVLGRPPR